MIDTPTHWAYQDEPIPQVPSGWKLVPIEPTEQMLDAGYFENSFYESYKAMLAAAPQPPKDEA